jgi:hypothetical protein
MKDLNSTGGTLKVISRYRIGNAQTIGRREVQSNYFSTKYNKAGDLLAVLADGTIDHPNGRRAAIMAVEYCVIGFLRNDIVLKEQALQITLKTAIEISRHIQGAVFLGKSPHLSLTMMLFANEEMQYFNVGSNKIYFYNGNNERILDADSNDPYSSGKYKVPAKSIIGIMSTGAYAVTHPMERIKIIESEKKVFDKAQAIVEVIKGKELDNQPNATALLIEVAK